VCEDRGMTTNQPMPTRSDIAAKVGVVLYDKTVAVDAILADAVERVRARGITAGGLLQRAGEQLPNGKNRLWAQDLATGQTIRLDRPRGPGAKDCILDPDALAQAACMLRRATEEASQLMVINRFGHAETEGGGMRAEIADAICSPAVVLIPVRFTRLVDLEDFLGGPATVLLPSAAAVADWVEQAVTVHHPATARN
jgi:hypothetical protein